MLLNVAEISEYDFYTQIRQQLDIEASWSNISLVKRSVRVSSTPPLHTLTWFGVKSSSKSFIAFKFDARLSCVYDEYIWYD